MLKKWFKFGKIKLKGMNKNWKDVRMKLVIMETQNYHGEWRDAVLKKSLETFLTLRTSRSRMPNTWPINDSSHAYSFRTLIPLMISVIILIRPSFSFICNTYFFPKQIGKIQWHFRITPTPPRSKNVWWKKSPVSFELASWWRHWSAPWATSCPDRLARTGPAPATRNTAPKPSGAARTRWDGVDPSDPWTAANPPTSNWPSPLYPRENPVCLQK